MPSSDKYPPGWCRQCGDRLRFRWPLKMAGTVAGMAAFFAAYFWVLRHPLFPVTVMPLTALDRQMDFHPWAAVPYVSLWVYVSLAPALLRTHRELLSLGISWLVLAGLGLGTFLLWPTTVPARAVSWEAWPAFSFLQTVDTGGNACPSLHVAFAVLSGIQLSQTLQTVGAAPWVRGGNWMWCTAICWSTLATRQHVVLDVVAGASLGAVIGFPHRRRP